MGVYCRWFFTWNVLHAKRQSVWHLNLGKKHSVQLKSVQIKKVYLVIKSFKAIPNGGKGERMFHVSFCWHLNLSSCLELEFFFKLHLKIYSAQSFNAESIHKRHVCLSSLIVPTWTVYFKFILIAKAFVRTKMVIKNLRRSVIPLESSFNWF